MMAISRHEVDKIIPLLPPDPLLAIRAIPAGNDKVPAPIIDFTRLKTSCGMVALATDDDEEVDTEDDDDC